MSRASRVVIDLDEPSCDGSTSSAASVPGTSARRKTQRHVGGRSAERQTAHQAERQSQLAAASDAQSRRRPRQQQDGEQLERKRARATSDAVDEAQFSDGEPEPETTSNDPLDDLEAGFDFSNEPKLADANQPKCALCQQDFQIVWDAERQELVVADAVLMKYVMYHTACVTSQRGGLAP